MQVVSALNRKPMSRQQLWQSAVQVPCTLFGLAQALRHDGLVQTVPRQVSRAASGSSPGRIASKQGSSAGIAKAGEASQMPSISPPRQERKDQILHLRLRSIGSISEYVRLPPAILKSLVFLQECPRCDRFRRTPPMQRDKDWNRNARHNHPGERANRRQEVSP